MRVIIPYSVALLFLLPASLLADGGTMRLSQRAGDFQITAFTSPAVLRCGIIDVSALVQDAASGKVRTDLPISITLSHISQESGSPTLSLEQSATTAAATNKLFRAAAFDIPEPGTWRASISLPTTPSAHPPTHSAEPLTFDLVVSPPLPAWLELAPWIAWPFAFVALFLIHQRLAAAAAR